jgi:hypothetical protein
LWTRAIEARRHAGSRSRNELRQVVTPAGFGNWFRAACDAVQGLPKGLSFHGLRKAVCRRVSEAQGDARSTKHIQAVSGHTLKMVRRYTQAADKKRLQREAGQPLTFPKALKHFPTFCIH